MLPFFFFFPVFVSTSVSADGGKSIALMFDSKVRQCAEAAPSRAVGAAHREQEKESQGM